MRLTGFWAKAAGVGGLVVALGSISPARAQPHVYTVGLVFTDAIDRQALPAHLQRQHPVVVGDTRREIRALFTAMGRFHPLWLRSIGPPEDPEYIGASSVDFIAHITLNKAYKIYSNQVRYFYGDDLFNRPTANGQDGGTPYEVISRPAVSGQFEVKLVNPHNNKIFWSALRDSTVIIPYERDLFLYNSWKYPGLSHPDLVRSFLADILRLQQANSSVERALNVSERWFISSPRNDVETVEGLLRGLTLSFAADLDGNLPLEGRIAALLPPQKDKPHVRLNIGANHGLGPRMRLDVWRPRPADQKVGQLEIVKVDSTTAVARLRKLDRKLRKRGEGLQVLDRVISSKRPPRRAL
ncbi:MAG: hypothetical protein GKR89_16505 [Candidatus Latescibacteria bacterium]|nr:hypothetical protein [Candidatus Latescibacterota bacterium]